MSKRFTDTELWKKPWFMELTPAEKLAWFYIVDECDNVGVWVANFRLAEFQIGQQLDWDKFVSKTNGNIEILHDGKWWIADFCEFQHRDFVKNPNGGNSKALQSYVDLLQKHGLYQRWLEKIDAHSVPIPMGSRDRVEDRVEDRVQVGARDEVGQTQSISAMKMPEAQIWQEALISLEPSSAWSSFDKERKSLVTLGRQTQRLLADTAYETTEEVVKAVLVEYKRARDTARHDYWRHAPFTPSAVLARWSDVVTRLADNYHAANAEVVF